MVQRRLVCGGIALGMLMLSAASGAAQADPVPSAPQRVLKLSPPPLQASTALRMSSGSPAWSQPVQAHGALPVARPSMDDDRTGSTFVPMDSEIYPALERLSSMGLVPSQSVSIRPWTRQECRRQVRQAVDILYGFGSLDYDVDAGVREEAARLLPELQQILEEPDGQATAVLDSVYVREGAIVGPALTDGFHFGQTWWNDYGRPLGRGNSVLLGYSARAVAGRFFLFNRQEMQTDPGLPAITPGRAALFTAIDDASFTAPGLAVTPQFPPQPAIAAYVRQRPLDLYAGVAFAGNALSFGKQEIYWGPTTMGPWAFSSNAEPTYNLRLQATRPHPYPFFPALGAYRFDLVFGKLSGHRFPARPYFNGQKLDLTFGRCLEMSVTRWSILWGVGHPMTLGSLKDNLFSSNSTGTSFQYADRADPGDRKSGFDFRLHVPGLSNLLTVYADGYADDELDPLDAPRRVAWQPGLYLARLPRASHADLRFEMASSEELSQDEGGTRFFINNQYRDGNTNKGFLLGNAVGRDGRAFEGRLGYWLSTRKRFEAGYRQNKISERLLPQGGTVSDGFVSARWGVRPMWMAEIFAQEERFFVPSYLPGSNHNGSVRLQITWEPHRILAVSP